MAKRVVKGAKSYKEAATELERILEQLRSGELGVDELTATVLRAKELIEYCRTQLLHTKEELESITQEEA